MDFKDEGKGEGRGKDSLEVFRNFQSRLVAAVAGRDPPQTLQRISNTILPFECDFVKYLSSEKFDRL